MKSIKIFYIFINKVEFFTKQYLGNDNELKQKTLCVQPVPSAHREEVCQVTLPFKKKFFFCGPFFKSELNLLQYCFWFMFWVFGGEACGILDSRPGIGPVPTALEDKVLTTGPAGKPPHQVTLNDSILTCMIPRVRASLISQLVKNPPAMQEMAVQFLGQEGPLEKE